MGFYDTKILPYLVEKICSGEDFMRLRKEKLAPLKGIGLEVGAGVGLNLPLYSDQVSKLYIIEPCETSKNKAKEVAKNCTFEVEFIDYLPNGSMPLKELSLDFVCSTWTMCTIPNIHETLLEVKRVLKQDGEFYFIEHGLSPDRYIGMAQNFLTPLQKTLGGGCHLNRKIDQYVLDAGFKIKELKNFYMDGIKIGGYLYSGIAGK